MKSLILLYATLLAVAGYAVGVGSFMIGSGASFVAVFVGCELGRRLRGVA